MQKLSYEKEFSSFILRLVCEKGGTRMQIPILDITKEMQKLDPLDKINLHRKQYGNTEGALKNIAKPFFYLDNTVLKFKDHDSFEQLYKEKVISKEDFEFYQKTYDANSLKIIEVMKINKQNKCSVLNFTIQ